MMKGRSIAALLVAGVVVIALAFWSAARGPRESTPQSGGAKLLPALAGSINSVAEVRLIKGDGTRTTLRKGPRYWVVVERDYPADSGHVRKLLLDLAELRTVEDKTRDPAHYGQLGVEDVSSPKASGTRIELVEPQSTATLILGKPSGTKSSYVRVAGDPQSWLASPQVTADADPKRWLDNAVMDLPQARIREVAVQPGSGPAYTLSRNSPQQSDFTVSNIPKGRELLGAGSADAGATALTSLTLDDVRKLDTAGTSPAASAAPGAGAQAHTLASPIAASANAGPAQTTFRTFNGLTIVMAGHQEGDRHLIHIVSVQSTSPETRDEAQRLQHFTGWEMEVPGYKYDVMFRSLEDLLRKPEPKTAAQAPASTPLAHKGRHPSASASPVPGTASPKASPAP
jgi:Domain of unknown function (DUF4340)